MKILNGDENGGCTKPNAGPQTVGLVSCKVASKFGGAREDIQARSLIYAMSLPKASGPVNLYNGIRHPPDEVRSEALQECRKTHIACCTSHPTAQ